MTSFIKKISRAFVCGWVAPGNIQANLCLLAATLSPWSQGKTGRPPQCRESHHKDAHPAFRSMNDAGWDVDDRTFANGMFDAIEPHGAFTLEE